MELSASRKELRQPSRQEGNPGRQLHCETNEADIKGIPHPTLPPQRPVFRINQSKQREQHIAAGVAQGTQEGGE